MTDFDSLWRAAVRFRRASRELEPLLHDVHNAFGDDDALSGAIERVLVFLASAEGRTDANCSVTDQFISVTEERWRPSSLAPILDDMGGTLHDAIHAEAIARTFEATPEQLLERVRKYKALPESARRVQKALAAAGITTQVVELSDSTRTAVDAANAVGCQVAQIVKSLLFRRGDAPLLILASGSNRVDEKLVNSHLNGAIAKADADFVRATTGYAIGGVPPLGHATPIETLIDEDLLKFDVVWAAAGTPRSVFPIEPRELVRATGGRVLRVA
jgi:prolyl-tRNA editing enzyme YbaK/EbsC (Cys-tRNA(Pro) deacylase)